MNEVEINNVNLMFQEFSIRIKSLVIYKNILKDPVIESLIIMSRSLINDNTPSHIYSLHSIFINNLITRAEELGLRGNIFAKYVVYLFLNDINIFSIACEQKKDLKNSTIRKIAEFEIGVMNYLVSIDIKSLSNFVGYEFDISKYIPVTSVNHEEIDFFIDSSLHDQNFLQLVSYYQNVGSSALSKGKAFKYDDVLGLVSINEKVAINLDDIVGYDLQKQKIISNISNFLNSRKFSNLLLVGSRGTGRSTIINGIVNKFYSDGLRIIRLNKKDIRNIADILKIVKNSGKKAIIYIDGLTNEDILGELSDLKLIMKSHLNDMQNNVIFCADYDVCSNEEKIIIERGNNIKMLNEISNLVNIFDNTIIFKNLDNDTFYKIVINAVKSEKLSIPEELLLKQAEEWISNLNSINGKDAMNFINFIKGELEK